MALIPFPPESLDVVISLETLERVLIPIALAELVRVAKIGEGW